jgi:sortase B
MAVEKVHLDALPSLEFNQYYANHRFDGTEDPAGMIYMDFRCPVEPLGENTILYGHNMKDGTRFGSLKEFVDTEMLLKYPVFQLTTLYANHRFVPIAIFYTTAEEERDQYFDFAQCEFADQWAFERYIISIKARSEVEIPATAVYGDKLLTLATCSSVMDRGRLVVVCKELL